MDIREAFPWRVDIGSFELSGSQLVVCDPGHDLNAISHGSGVVLENCLPGTWSASVVLARIYPDGPSICTELRALHPEGGAESGYDWVTHEKCVGVDTGQAGIYDLAHFRDATVVPADMKWTHRVSKTVSLEEAKQHLPAEQWEFMMKHPSPFDPTMVSIPTDECGPADPADLWCSYCYELTTGARMGGVLPFGVVAESGVGDGGYPFATAAGPDGEIIGVRITFLDDDKLADLLGND